MAKQKNTNTPNMSGGGVSVSRETRNEQRADSVRKRVPMHESGIAHIPAGVVDEDNYHYRWCADYDKGKIERYLQGGYEFVEDDRGQRIVRMSGDNLWLMRIPKRLWDQDQEAKRGRQIQVQNQQREKQFALQQGDVPEYLPKV